MFNSNTSPPCADAGAASGPPAAARHRAGAGGHRRGGALLLASQQPCMHCVCGSSVRSMPHCDAALEVPPDIRRVFGGARQRGKHHAVSNRCAYHAQGPLSPSSPWLAAQCRAFQHTPAATRRQPPHPTHPCTCPPLHPHFPGDPYLQRQPVGGAPPPGAERAHDCAGCRHLHRLWCAFEEGRVGRQRERGRE